jgi:glucose-6-phosphate 1-dehydrogenase
MDALNGDASLFTRADATELAWELVDPIVTAWDGPGGPPLYSYSPGSWGPAAADQLLERDGRSWIRMCGIHQTPVELKVFSQQRPIPRL